jgi:hypothetical protein
MLDGLRLQVRVSAADVRARVPGADDRTRQIACRVALRVARNYAKAIRTSLRKPDTLALLEPVFVLAGEPMISITVYPLPGPYSRIGGEAHPESSSAEIWYSLYGPPLPDSHLALTVTHECGHLILEKALVEASETGSCRKLRFAVSEALVRAMVRYPLETTRSRDRVLTVTGLKLAPFVMEYIDHRRRLDRDLWMNARRLLRAVEAGEMLRGREV